MSHLIQQVLDGIPAFYSVRVGRDFGSPHGWTGVHDKALQFARPEDAQAFLDTFLPHHAPVCTIAHHEGKPTNGS